MAKINLLPWREELRKEKQKEFLTLLGMAAVFALVVWGGVHFYHTQLIEYHQARNHYLEQEIAKLDEKIKEIKRLEKEKERLLARMRAIEQLQGNRPLLDDLPCMPVGGLAYDRREAIENRGCSHVAHRFGERRKARG